MATIFGGVIPPPNADRDTVSPDNRMLAMEWETAASGKQIGDGYIYIPSTGKPADLHWLVFNVTTNTLEADIDCDGLSASASTWLTVPNPSKIPVTPGDRYQYAAWFPLAGGGDYPYGTSGGPIDIGDYVDAQCVYKNGGTISQKADQYNFTGGLFFADGELEDADSDQVEELEQVTRQTTANAMTFDKVDALEQVTRQTTTNANTYLKVDQLPQIARQTTVNPLNQLKADQLEQVTRQTTVNAMSYQKVAVLTQIARQTTVQPMSYTGGAGPVAGGWIPKVNRHVVYLEQKTYGGNTNYVKRRPAIITAVVSGNTVDLRIGRSGEVHSGVERRLDPTSTDVGVYVSY